jgi:hypothetical protein
MIFPRGVGRTAGKAYCRYAVYLYSRNPIFSQGMSVVQSHASERVSLPYHEIKISSIKRDASWTINPGLLPWMKIFLTSRLGKG